MRIVKADKEGITLAIKYLREGKAVVYPTETAYGLGVDATNAEAVRLLYKIKGRAYKKPTHVIVSNLSAVKNDIIVDAGAARLMKKFWPGALTIVLPLKNNAPQPPLKLRGGEGELSALMLLSAGTGTIGIRIPNNKVALALARKLGRPITATSANPASGEAPYSIRDSLRQFTSKPYQPDLYLDAGKLPKQEPSTIVKVEGNKIKILRKGCIIFPAI